MCCQSLCADKLAIEILFTHFTHSGKPVPSEDLGEMSEISGVISCEDDCHELPVRAECEGIVPEIENVLPMMQQTHSCI